MTKERRTRIDPLVSGQARELRQPQTPAEAKLWFHLRERRLNGWKFRRQHPIGLFIVDFCCPDQHLVIEVDGDTHAYQEAYDERRTAWLEEQGYRVLRFTNIEVSQSLPAVLEAIFHACEPVE